MTRAPRLPPQPLPRRKGRKQPTHKAVYIENREPRQYELTPYKASLLLAGLRLLFKTMPVHPTSVDEIIDWRTVVEMTGELSHLWGDATALDIAAAVDEQAPYA